MKQFCLNNSGRFNLVGILNLLVNYLYNKRVYMAKH